MNILVIDGQGGRLGRKLVESIRRVCPDAVITAVGTNSTATESMMGTGCADHLATGENAVIVACRTAHIIAGPFGIATADAMMGSGKFRYRQGAEGCQKAASGAFFFYNREIQEDVHEII